MPTCLKNNIFPSIICLLLLTGIFSCTIRLPQNKSVNQSVYWDTIVIGNGRAYEICAMIYSVRQGIAISYDSFWRKTAEITYVNGECYSWRTGSNIMNNTPTQKANNLIRSIWNWIIK